MSRPRSASGRPPRGQIHQDLCSNALVRAGIQDAHARVGRAIPVVARESAFGLRCCGLVRLINLHRQRRLAEGREGTEASIATRVSRHTPTASMRAPPILCLTPPSLSAPPSAHPPSPSLNDQQLKEGRSWTSVRAEEERLGPGPGGLGLGLGLGATGNLNNMIHRDVGSLRLTGLKF